MRDRKVELKSFSNCSLFTLIFIGGQTPLHITTTVSACRDTLVTLLMNRNLSPELKNNSNETAYQIAKRSGFSSSLFNMVHPALSVETGIID